MPGALRISAAEWEVMHVLWQAATPVPVREIVDSLSRLKGWQPSTSRTLLRRLVHKKAVKVRISQRPFLYQAIVTREACVRVESHSFLKRAFGGKPVELLVQLVEDTPLTPEDVKRLKDILSRKEG
jgi:BlaI family penicillinase repressor